MLEKNWEGKETEIKVITVTREEIKRYCSVIGEKNPLYFDVETARSFGYHDILIPTTYPVIFWQQIEVPWLLVKGTMVQGEQVFNYKKPLVAETAYRCFIKLVRMKSLREKTYLTNRLYIFNQDELVATSDSVVVLLKGKSISEVGL